MATKRRKPKARPKARVRKSPSKKGQRKPKQGEFLKALVDTVLFNSTDPVKFPSGTQLEVVEIFNSILLVRPVEGDRRFWLNWAIRHGDWKAVER